MPEHGRGVVAFPQMALFSGEQLLGYFLDLCYDGGRLDQI